MFIIGLGTQSVPALATAALYLRRRRCSGAVKRGGAGGIIDALLISGGGGIENWAMSSTAMRYNWDARVGMNRSESAAKLGFSVFTARI